MSDDFRTEMIGCLPRLRRFALALTGDHEGADDLVQETCLRALSRVEQFQAGTRLDSWMFRIAQNVWLDKVRSKQARGQHLNMDDAPMLADAESHRRIEDHVAVREVSQALGKLPAELQMLVMLVCVDGRSYRETSDMLAMPIGTVMSRLARARRLLHETLNGASNEAVAGAS